METLSFESELDLVIKAIHQYPAGKITGALLGTLIKNTAKSLNIREVVEMPFGPGALTKFIHLYLSDHLNQSGKKGGDVVYTILHDDAPTTSIANTSPPNIWAVFINPVNKYSIYLNLSEMTLSVLSSDNDLQTQNFAKIDNLTPEELQSIQAEFMAHIAQGKEDHPLIIRLLAATSNSDWFNILKLSHSPDYKNWLIFRRKRIEELFAKRLRKLSLSDHSVKQLVESLMTTQYHAAEASRVTKAAKNVSNIAASMSPPTQHEEHQFRQGLIAAISEMSIEDLRQLSLPYGAVFDSLTKLRR